MIRTEAEQPQPQLKRVLGLWDIVFFTVVAVTGLRWISRGARAGAPSVLLWVLAWLAFFVPLALAVSVLAKKHPDQGGIYAWVHRAFGPFASALCGWCLWVNNLFYFPSLLLFAAANAAAMFGSLAPGLGDSRLFSTIFVLGFLWFSVGISIQGFEAGRWLQNLGVIGTWVPVALLIVGAAVVFGSLGSATGFAPSAMVPRAASRAELFGVVGLWSSFCFAFAGFEIGAFASQEIHDPERTLPRGIAISGAIVTLIYIAGTVAVLIMVPADQLAERSGIADAVDLAATRIGLPAVGPLTAFLLAASAIAGCTSWMAGSARIAYAAAREGQWPAPLGALHRRYRTPHVALYAQGAVATLIFLSSLFLTIGGGTTTVQESYDILVNLTIVVYFVPYLYLFVGLTRLLKGAELTVGLRLAAAAGLAATVISMILVFVPPEGTSNVLNYEANLIWQTAAVVAGGVGLYYFGRRQKMRSRR
jgi:glutamate:GABA antiporter